MRSLLAVQVCALAALGCAGPGADGPGVADAARDGSGASAETATLEDVGVAPADVPTEGGGGDATDAGTDRGGQDAAVPPPPGPSVLGDLARSMAPGSFAKMPANAGLKAFTLANSLLYWADSGVWNPLAKRLQWVGGPGTCCADPAAYKMLTYEVATDTWQVLDTPYVGSGHAYDGNALNPVTGLHYFGKKDEPAIKTWNGTAWGTLLNLPFTAATTPSLVWFPEFDGGAGGLIYLSEGSHLAAFDGTKWTSIAGLQLGEYNTFAEYNPVHGVVWLGGGNDVPRVHYKLDAARQLTKLMPAPIPLGNGQAVESLDPVSGKYIVLSTPGSSKTPLGWWEYDIVKDAWAELSPKDPPDAGAVADGVFSVPLADYGVTLFFVSAIKRDVYLYKHTP